MFYKIDYEVILNLYVDFLEATFWAEHPDACWSQRIGAEFGMLRIPTW